MAYYNMYKDVLGGIVGDYRIQISEQNIIVTKDGQIVIVDEEWVNKQGVKVFAPFPIETSYSHSDDFGNPRTYGGERDHLGNDFMANEGTPLIAIEPGCIEKIGWDRLGGWRVGLRSLDNKRYYYYAHMRGYAITMRPGTYIEAGTILGYCGSTGYSDAPGISGKFAPHLHLQISVNYTVEGKTETVWNNPYHLTKFINIYGLKQSTNNPVIIESNK